jgi:hypothetical protein
MSTRKVADKHMNNPRTVAALRAVRLLVGCYLAVSLLVLLVAFVLRNDADAVTDAVWTRGIIMAASAVLTLGYAVHAARGSRRAYLRLRIVTAVMVMAIAVIIAVPGAFPVWMKIEQGVCGLVLAAVIVIINGRRVRASFAR